MHTWSLQFVFLAVLAIFVPALTAQDSGAKQREQYAVLALNLVPALQDGSAIPELDLEPAVLEAKERWRVIQMGELEVQDRRLKAVAKEAAASHDAIINLANESEDGDAILELALALVMGSPRAVLRGLRREVQGAAGNRYAVAIQRRRAATFLLPELAAELAGPRQKKAALEVDFDENWFGTDTPDRLNLKNVSERSLTNCTLQVDIRGANGKWMRNIHFVPAWDAGKVLWADYASSDPSLLASISGTTATEVEDVKVSLWCNELNGVSEIRYPGALRDADRLAQLDRLISFEVDYVGEPFFEHGPCIGVKLGGVTLLRQCEVRAVCHGGGGDDQKLEVSLEAWGGGQRISLQSRGALLGCPSSLEVTVKCDGMEKGVTKTVEISQSR